jgi:hypothetical protein
MTKTKVKSQTGSLTPNHEMSGIDPTFVRAGGVQTHSWKAFDESYNFALDLVLMGGLNTKL